LKETGKQKELKWEERENIKETNFLYKRLYSTCSVPLSKGY